eukprot:763268-Hanusia_phi.AAC.3
MSSGLEERTCASLFVVHSQSPQLHRLPSSHQHRRLLFTHSPRCSTAASPRSRETPALLPSPP